MYAGIDLGSTNIKAAIYDENFRLIDRQSRPVVYIRENGFVEFDAAVYCRELVQLLADMVKANHASAIRQIAFTGQAESLVVLGADGEPLMNAISWMDERSVEECEALSKQFGPVECEAVTGQMAVLPTWPATKIAWLRKHRPEVYKSAATYMLLKDYVVFYLTGRKMADILGVPEEYELVCFLPVGIPAEGIRPVKKQSFGSRAWLNGFGKEMI